MGEGEKTAFTTTFKVSAPFPQRQPRSLTGRWHKLLVWLGHPCWDLPTRMGARQAPLGHPLRTSNTREASQGSRWREDVSSASFPKEIQKKKNQISTPAAHGSRGMYLESSASTPSPLLCRSRDIIRAVLWTTLVAEEMSRRFPF